MTAGSLPPRLADAICATLAAAGAPLPVRVPFTAQPLGGGSIDRAFAIGEAPARYFVKLAPKAADRFAGEADGLAALARCTALVVPRVIGHGAAGDDDFLILEWLPLTASGDETALGCALAALHAITLPRYGWPRDNHIGRTPQQNACADDWASFFIERRLRPQLALAAPRHPQLAARAAAAIAAATRILADHTPPPSLLHGDLWRGNAGFANGRPALYDPAVYAGDAESDLAMAELFGGFPSHFFAAYARVRPALPGASARRPLYQLYHVLNHANLFAGAYVQQAATLIDRLA